MQTKTQRIDRFWTSDWSLSVLLTLMVTFIFFLIPLDVLGLETPLVGAVPFTLILFSGIVAVSHSTAMAVLFSAVALVSIAVHWARYAIYGTAWIGYDAIASFIAVAMLATIVLTHVFRAGPITASRIQGAIAAYLLIALMFAAIYMWIDFHTGNTAFGGSYIAPLTGENPLRRFVYFSFTTLTTVGYGDVVPINSFARAMSNLEAVIGQIFPAILLARLVSLEVSDHLAPRRETGAAVDGSR